MKRDDVENAFDNLFELMHSWDGRDEIIELAIQQINKALDEAVDSVRGDERREFMAAIRELKIK